MLPVSGLVTTLHDEVKPMPGGQISWSTHWQLCWNTYPGAQAYELQVMTDEGTSPRLRRLPGRWWTW
ncbi:hypothetical protein [Hymenobacter roseosalivarius]|uniref:hypothetical protein n=1 Tax=Hymenobacter roseosalivarius TaxID=89967 RepID=UPI0011799B59|nr:hypothetical protein [Hymenobacter roseosalivarius]